MSSTSNQPLPSSWYSGYIFGLLQVAEKHGHSVYQIMTDVGYELQQEVPVTSVPTKQDMPTSNPNIENEPKDLQLIVKMCDQPSKNQCNTVKKTPATHSRPRGRGRKGFTWNSETGQWDDHRTSAEKSQMLESQQDKEAKKVARKEAREKKATQDAAQKLLRVQRREEKANKALEKASKPKRPSSAYMLWLNANRIDLAHKYPTLKGKHLATKAGEIWNQDITTEQKAHWVELNQKQREEYHQAMAHHMLRAMQD